MQPFALSAWPQSFLTEKCRAFCRFFFSKQWLILLFFLQKTLSLNVAVCDNMLKSKGLVAFYCPAVPLLCWYFVFIQTPEYDLFSPKPAWFPSNILINQRLLRQPLYNPAIQKIKLPQNQCICTHNLQNSVNVYNNTAFYSVIREKKRSKTTKNWLNEKMLNKAETSKEKEERRAWE